MREAWLLWGKAHGIIPQREVAAAGTANHAVSGSSLGSQRVPPLEETFDRLASIWHAETCYLSSTSAIVNHPAYQEIIALGPDVVPFVLRDLEINHRHWFEALHRLTGADPTNPADCGKVRKLAEA